MSTEVRPMTEDDRERVALLIMQAFNRPQAAVERAGALSVEGRWVAVANGVVVATLGLEPCGQFFGGEPLPSVGIGAVAVAPEKRSEGYGGILLTEVVRRLHREGVALACLYPSTMAPYRRVGFELGGTRVRHRLSVEALPRRADATVEPWDDDDLDAVDACYRRFASARHGLVERSARWWRERVLRSSDGHLVHRYAVRRHGRVTGYVVFSQVPADGPLPWYHAPGDAAYNYDLACRDLVWEDDESAAALLAFLAGHRAVAVDVTWPAAFDDPLMLLLADRQPRVDLSYGWMLRLLDLEQALTRRRYPEHVSVDIGLEVHDPTIAAHERTFTFSVAGGTATVVEGAARPSTVDIGALASIFTGRLDPADAARLGRLAPADDDALRAIRAVFTGPSPWIIDLF